MKKIEDIESFSRLVNHSGRELFDITEKWKSREIDPDLLFSSVKEIAYRLINASNGE